MNDCNAPLTTSPCKKDLRTLVQRHVKVIKHTVGKVKKLFALKLHALNGSSTKQKLTLNQSTNLHALSLHTSDGELKRYHPLF